MSSRRPLQVSFVVFGLLVAACTGGDGDGALSTDPPTPPPPPTTATTAAPPPPTTTAPVSSPPPPATTAVPAALEPQALSFGFAPGDLVTYEGSLETRLSWSGGSLSAVFEDASGVEGKVIAEWTGRQRLLVLAAGDSLELVEDFTAEEGSFIIEDDGAPTITEFTRDELLDFKPPTPPILIDQEGRFRPEPGSGAPRALIVSVGPLAAAAVIGPPFSSNPVDVGDSWTAEFEDPLLGTVVIDVEIVSEEETADGTLVFVIDFSGRSDDLPRDLDLVEALDLTGAPRDSPGLASLLPPDAAGLATVRSVDLSGTMQFDPVRGIALEFESREGFAMDLSFEAGEEVVAFSLESGATRSFALTGYARAAPFAVESVLDRFEVDPFTLASATFAGLTDYELIDVTGDEVDSVFARFFDARLPQDLFAGSTIVNLVDGDGESAIALAVTTGGVFRGDPIVAREVAAFVSGSTPREVSIGESTVYRVTIDGAEWLMYSNQTHLFVTIGPRGLSQRIMADFVESVTPYLWQPGDCLDFTDDFDSAVPHAPFGIHGLRHCTVDHTYEVIYSEVLPEGSAARYPSDLEERSVSACGSAFHEFAGTTELKSALSLISYLPDEIEWEQGSRYFACAVYLTGPDGEIEVNARIDGRDPELMFTLEVGTCLFSLSPFFSLFPVECDDPHHGEVIAVFDVSEGPRDPMPDVDDLRALIAERCEAAFDDFNLGSGPGRVDVFGITDLFAAWEFGVRRYYCVAVAFGNGGFRLGITGTFAGEWEEAVERVAV